jgi:DNA gyrase subunit A
VVGMLLVRREAAVLTMTEEGAGRKCPVADFPLQKRGGLGTLAAPAGEESSMLVAALEVLEGDEVMAVTAAGRVARVDTDGIPLQGRRTRGRKVVDLEKNDRVVEVTRIPGEGRRDAGADGDGPDGDPEGGGSGEEEAEQGDEGIPAGQLDLLGRG